MPTTQNIATSHALVAWDGDECTCLAHVARLALLASCGRCWLPSRALDADFHWTPVYRCLSVHAKEKGGSPTHDDLISYLGDPFLLRIHVRDISTRAVLVADGCTYEYLGFDGFLDFQTQRSLFSLHTLRHATSAMFLSSIGSTATHQAAAATMSSLTVVWNFSATHQGLIEQTMAMRLLPLCCRQLDAPRRRSERRFPCEDCWVGYISN